MVPPLSSSQLVGYAKCCRACHLYGVVRMHSEAFWRLSKSNGALCRCWCRSYTKTEFLTVCQVTASSPEYCLLHICHSSASEIRGWILIFRLRSCGWHRYVKVSYADERQCNVSESPNPEGVVLTEHFEENCIGRKSSSFARPKDQMIALGWVGGDEVLISCG